MALDITVNICNQLVKIHASAFQVFTDIQMDVASGSMIIITVKQSMLNLLLHAQLKMSVDVNPVLLDTLVSLFEIAVVKSSCVYTFFVPSKVIGLEPESKFEVMNSSKSCKPFRFFGSRT